MALLKSLDSGVSGLRAFQTKMDVIGNNIANVETSGYKSSRVSFSEMLSQKISSGGGLESAPSFGAEVGLGVRIASIDRDFNQGGLQATGRSTDLALEGKGFFMVSDGAQNFMTRSGNFSFNKDGFLVDQSGRKVQGFNANGSGNILSSGITKDVRIDFENIFEPQATQNVFLVGNLDANTSKTQVLQAQTALTTSGGNIATTDTDLNDLAQTSTPLAAGDQISFDVTLNDGTNQTITHNYTAGDTVDDVINSINTGLGAAEGSASLVDGLMVLRSAQSGDSQFAVNNVTVTGAGDVNFPGFQESQAGETDSQTQSTTVYDELGNAHTMVLKMTQTDTNTWDYEANFLEGEQITSGGTGTINFDESGNLSSANNIAIDFDPGSGANPVSFNVNFGNPENGSRLTQFAGSSSATVVSQDGYTQGQLVDFSIDGAGSVNGIYDNGRNIQLAQLAIGDAYYIKALAHSFDVVPVGEGNITQAAPSFIKMATYLFIVGVQMAAPFILVLFLLDLSFAIFARIMPQANIFFIALPLKLGIGFILMMLILPYTPVAFEHFFNKMWDFLSMIINGMSG